MNKINSISAKLYKAILYIMDPKNLIYLIALLIIFLIILVYNTTSKKPYIKNEPMTEIAKNTNKNSKIVTLYHAPWCGHCKNLMPDWNKLKKTVSDVTFVEVNSDEQPNVIKSMGINGFPTIILTSKGKNIKYEGQRNVGAISEFIKAN